jgi:hypothetical protein
LDIYIADDPTVRKTIASHFFIELQGLEAYVVIDEDKARVVFDERSTSIKL